MSYPDNSNGGINPELARTDPISSGVVDAIDDLVARVKNEVAQLDFAKMRQEYAGQPTGDVIGATAVASEIYLPPKNPVEAIHDALTPPEAVTAPYLTNIETLRTELLTLHDGDPQAQSDINRTAAGYSWLYTGTPDAKIPDYYIGVEGPDKSVYLQRDPSISSHIAKHFSEAIEMARTVAVVPSEYDRRDEAYATFQTAFGSLIRSSTEYRLMHSFLTPPTPADRKLTPEEQMVRATIAWSSLSAGSGIELGDVRTHPALSLAYDRVVTRLDAETIRDGRLHKQADDPLARARAYFGRSAFTLDSAKRYVPLPVQNHRDIAYNELYGRLEIPSQSEYSGPLLASMFEIAQRTYNSRYDTGPTRYLKDKIAAIFRQNAQQPFDFRAEMDHLDDIETMRPQELKQYLGGAPSAHPIQLPTFLAAMRGVVPDKIVPEYKYYKAQAQGRYGGHSGVSRHLTLRHQEYLDSITRGRTVLDRRSAVEQVALRVIERVQPADHHIDTSLQTVLEIAYNLGYSQDDNLLPIMHGYVVTGRKTDQSGRDVVSYAYDPNGDPYVGDIPITEQQRDNLVLFFEGIGATRLADRVQRSHTGLREVEELIQRYSVYDLPDDNAFPRTDYFAIDGTLHMQCTTAGKLMEDVFGTVFGSHNPVRPVVGEVLVDGRVSGLGHEQRMIMMQGKRYIFDATPRRLREDLQPGLRLADLSTDGLQALINSIMAKKDSEPEQTIARGQTTGGTDGHSIDPATLPPQESHRPTAEARIALTHRRIADIRESTIKLLRVQLGLEASPAYAKPDGIAKYLVTHHASSDVIRTAYRQLTSVRQLASLGEASPEIIAERLAAIDHTIQQLQKAATARPIGRSRNPAPYDASVYMLLAGQLGHLRVHYDDLQKHMSRAVGRPNE